MWLGPAPFAPYNKDRVHFNFRWITDYSGGIICDWGAHLFDTAQWGNDTERSGPVEIEGTGTYWEGGLYNTVKDYDVTYRYANGVVMTCKPGNPSIKFIGTRWLGRQHRLARTARGQFQADSRTQRSGRTNCISTQIPKANTMISSSAFTAARIRTSRSTSATASRPCATWRTLRSSSGANSAGIRSPSSSLATRLPMRCSRASCAHPGNFQRRERKPEIRSSKSETNPKRQLNRRFATRWRSRAPLSCALGYRVAVLSGRNLRTSADDEKTTIKVLCIDVAIESSESRHRDWIGGFDPGAQHFGDAPGLRDAAAGSERRFGIEDFADGADAGLVQVRPEPVEKLARLGAIVRDGLSARHR